jgi:GntR family transcriptional regulator
MPRVERPVPPYAQIANYYRAEIVEGRLKPGERLPAIAAIADEWEVAATTAAKGVGLLQVEGLIYTSPQGSFVADPRGTSRTPRDRVTASPVHRIGTNGETVTVNAAEIVGAPAYVADVLGIAPGEQVIRREEVLYHGAHAQALTVDWIPATNVMEAAELLEAVPIAGGAITQIESVTRRRPTYGRDYVRGRAADAREAGALKLPVGAPILAGTHVWSDGEGVILYGEWCMPPDQVLSYDYSVPAGEDEPAG